MALFSSSQTWKQELSEFLRRAHFSFILSFFNIYFIYLAASGLSCSIQILACGMWDLVPWPGIEPEPPALGLWSLSHWTNREVPLVYSYTQSIAKHLEQSACVPRHFSRVRLFVTPWTVARQTPCPWDSPGNNTGMGCPALLQGIFPTQGSNPQGN